MVLNRAEKEQLVETLSAWLKEKRASFFVTIAGLKVNEITSLRRLLQEKAGLFKVAKTNLIRRAIAQAKLEISEPTILDKPIALAAGEDEFWLAKTLFDFSRAHPQLMILGGLIEGKPVLAEALEALAKLPSREELLARLVRALKSPLVRLSWSLLWPGYALGRVLAQYQARLQRAS